MPSPDHIIGAFPNAGPKEVLVPLFLAIKTSLYEYLVGQNNPKIACIKLG